MSKHLLVSCIISLLFQYCFAQQIELKAVKEKENYYRQKSTSISEDKRVIISESTPFSSLSIQINKSQTFDKAYVVSKKDTFYLTTDEHSTPKQGRINSNLISFETPISNIIFFSSKIEGNVFFHFINGDHLEGELNAEQKAIQKNQCLVEPESIPQNIWRNGLTPPVFNRSFSEVKHLIIHHSAGSNTNTNYTQVVRDIFIYHTEVNGWSDIGYNYLIAQDGTIYKGRDPLSGEQDNVRGAHFCGMNTGTMGVCLLGNYTNIPPTGEAILSLFKLLSWKLDKEALNAYEGFSFNSISNLNTISGHRDGCSTECPGTKTYEQISSFKNHINDAIEACYPEKLLADFEWDNEEIFAEQPINFVDISLGNPLSWIWDLDGIEQELPTDESSIVVQYQEAGDFDAQLIVRNGSRTDTAQKTIKVNPRASEEPLIFPNPIHFNQLMSVSLNKEKIDAMIITDVSGNILKHHTPETNSFTLDWSRMGTGLYFIRFFSSGEVVRAERVAVLK